MTTITKDEAMIVRVAETLIVATTKRELGTILVNEVPLYTLADLQVVGGRLHTELMRLPRPYEQVGPCLTDQILGGYHRLMTCYRSETWRPSGSTVRSSGGMHRGG